MGYPNLQKEYRVLEISTGEFIVSCDVIFHETIFPFSEGEFSHGDPEITSSHHSLHDEAPHREFSYIPIVQPRNPIFPTIPAPQDSNGPLNPSKHIRGDTLEEPIVDAEDITTTSVTSQHTTEVGHPRRSGRATKPPT